MRITSLDIKAYGMLVDRRFDDLSGGLVIVAGDNEAGKSTFFNLCTTLLYGFDPVTGFPYRPRGVDLHPEAAAGIVLGDRSVLTVSRKLAARPQGTLTRGESVERIGNEPLPFAGHVDRKLYSALYALSQEDLRSMDDVHKREIEDRLLGGLGADLLRPTREVIDEIGREVRRLWRPDNRVGPLHKQLQKALREVREARKKASDRDKKIRGDVEELASVEAGLEDLEAQKESLARMIRTAERLLPLKRSLDRIDLRRAEMADAEALDALPDELVMEVRRIDDDIERFSDELKDVAAKKEGLLAVRDALSDEDRFLLDREDRLVSWGRRSAVHEKEESDVKDLRASVATLHERITTAAEEILVEPWREDFSEAVSDVSPPELKGRVGDVSACAAAVERARAETVGDLFLPRPLSPWVGAAACGAGAGLFVAGLLKSATSMWTAGMLLGMIGVGALAAAIHRRRQNLALKCQRDSAIAQVEERGERAEAALEEAKDAFRKALGDLPVAAALCERPDEDLCRAIVDLRAMVADHGALRRQLEEREKTWEDAQRDLAELMDECGESATGEGLGRVEKRLDDARDRRMEARHAAKRIEELEDTAGATEKDLTRASRMRTALFAKISAAVGEDADEDDALREAVRRQRDLADLRHEEDQFRTECPDVEALRREIAEIEQESEKAWMLDPDEVEAHREHRLAVEEEMGPANRRAGELRSTIDTARDEDRNKSVATLDGEILVIQEQMRNVRIERDRLALLASVLLRADRQFREEHQPDVLRRAGEYLKRISGGRYRSIAMVPNGAGVEEMAVIATDDGNPLCVDDAHELSTGTRDQIYLAFRLAVVDHLDADHESLPLFLDEVLVNWDDKRLGRGAAILGEVAAKRQVFVFTCHEDIVYRLRRIPGASVIQLEST